MAKQTKRSRKFERKGGVKGMLGKKKGATITNKGKLPNKKKHKGNNNNEKSTPRKKDDTFQQEREEKRQELNFVSEEKSLGDLDMDSFFKSVEQSVENEEASSDSESDGGSSSSQADEKEAAEGKEERQNSSDDDSSDVPSSSESSDSEEEDIQEASLKLKKQMEHLEEAGPDFHKFLKENESSLLEFDEGDEEDEEDDKEIYTTGKITNKSPSANADSKVGTILTPELFKSYQKGAFEQHGIKGLRKVVGAFKSACHLADEDATENKYKIESSKVFHNVMVSCLDHVHEEFHHHLTLVAEDAKDGNAEEEVDFNKPLSPKLFHNNAKFQKLKSIMETFFKAVVHVLDHQAKDAELLAVILKKLAPSTRYLMPFPKLCTKFLITLTRLWSSPHSDDEEAYQVVRVEAFLRIRQMALVQPFPFVEECLKKTYLAYAQRAKFVTSSSTNTTNTTTLPTLIFMGNCLVELYGLDYHSSYQHAFVYIRQLALLLRTAMQKQTPQVKQQVYCWQYIHCLKLWTAVLVNASTQDERQDDSNDKAAALLKSLVYPLVEVIEGMMSLVATTRHTPIQLHGIQMLQQLAAATKSFIPTSGVLLEILGFKELCGMPVLKDKSKKSRGIHLGQMLKFGQDQPLRTKEQQEAVVSEVFQLLNREIDLYRFSAGFPELAVGIRQRLQKFAKETRNTRWRAYAKGCIEVCKKHSAAAVQGRAKLQEAPKDVQVLECLKPTNEPNMYARHMSILAKSSQSGGVAGPLSIGQAAISSDGSARKLGSQKRKAKDEVPVASKKEKKKTKAKKPRRANESDLKNVESLKEEDQVKEGIDWSDDDSE